MKTISTSRRIEAPVERVFATVADIANYAKAVDTITAVEFIGEKRRGVGTRFRETRLMKGRPQTTELEVTEFAENDHVRMVSDAGGTIWDTVFQVRADKGATELSMRMEARPYRLLARIFNPLIRGMVVRAVESDMDAVRRHCEASKG